MYLTTIQQEITKITGCIPEDAPEIEDILCSYLGDLKTVKCSVFARFAQKVWLVVNIKHHLN
jgi:hypothetical protein